MGERPERKEEEKRLAGRRDSEIPFFFLPDKPSTRKGNFSFRLIPSLNTTWPMELGPFTWPIDLEARAQHY
jgi:hypothetical protein